MSYLNKMYGRKAPSQTQSSSNKNPNRVTGGLKAQGVDRFTMLGEDGTQQEVPSLQYVNRVNIEYMKIVLRGTTMTVSSGDAGAPGRTNEECDVNNPINPVFPGSSPFVVSVGATYTDKTNKTRDYKSPICLNNACITDNNEKSISFDNVGWTAGGGFDLTRNSTPWWQKSVVDKYLNSGVQLPPDTNFNRNGRAYPDVSALGHSCPTYINGQLGGVDGTSCSSPVVAGLLTIIKEHLWKTKKIKIGHINPLLYYI